MVIIRNEIKALLSTINIDSEKKPLILAEHPLVALEMLKQYKSSKYDGLPFILLLLDVKEEIDRNYCTASLNFVIGCITKQIYSTDEREEQTFTKILRPLYTQLIEKLQQNDNQFTKYDRYLWGKQGLYGVTGNIFDDYIDAIELNDIKYKVLINKCK